MALLAFVNNSTDLRLIPNPKSRFVLIFYQNFTVFFSGTKFEKKLGAVTLTSKLLKKVRPTQFPPQPPHSTTPHFLF